MPHEGYVDPVMNNGPRFHSNMPVSELIEHVTRAIEASDVSSAPPVVKTKDGVMHENSNLPLPRPTGLGAQDTQTPRHDLIAPSAWIRDSDSPNPSLRPALGFSTPTHPFPRCAQCPDPQLRLARSLVAPSS
jgi:hypothetical protein